jgi:cytochrome c553
MTSLAYGQKRWDSPKVVTVYCSGCHGVDGNAQLPYFPRLAGMQVAYSEKKLGAFKEPMSPQVDELFAWVSGEKRNVTRDERINMEGVAHAASPEVIKEALIWYSQQQPAPGHGSDKKLMAAGEEIFRKGVPAQKILPCMTCHGENAEGKGTAPRLAGQNAEYVESQLVKFRKGDRSHAPEMTMVTRDLDATQAHAAAAYLQSR